MLSKSCSHQFCKIYRKTPATASVCNFAKINTPLWVFFKFFKLYKWYQTKQDVSYTKIQSKNLRQGLLFLQSCISSVKPLQLAPPFFLGGLSGVRERFCWPSPHVLLHSDHLDHCDQLQSTKQYKDCIISTINTNRNNYLATKTRSK